VAIRVEGFEVCEQAVSGLARIALSRCSASSLRTQGPIRRVACCERRCSTISHNPTPCGYGSRLGGRDDDVSFNDRHCERSEAIQLSLRQASWIASSPALLAMTSRYSFAFPRRISPGLCIFVSPKRAWGMPGAQCTRSPAGQKKSRAGNSHHRSTGIIPAFPHTMVLSISFVLSPVTGLVCHRRRRITPPT
jgi:hypothetical protein